MQENTCEKEGENEGVHERQSHWRQCGKRKTVQAIIERTMLEKKTKQNKNIRTTEVKKYKCDVMSQQKETRTVSSHYWSRQLRLTQQKLKAVITQDTFSSVLGLFWILESLLCFVHWCCPPGSLRGLQEKFLMIVTHLVASFKDLSFRGLKASWLNLPKQHGL